MLALSVGSVVPASAANAPDDDLTKAQNELASTQAGIDRLLADIEGVEREVAAADARLAELTDVLTEVERSKAEAQRAAAVADTQVEAARAAMVVALTEAQAAQARWEAAREVLENRVAMIWIHGPGDSAERMLDGLMVAQDLHDVAVMRQASGRQVDADSSMVADADAAATEAADAHALADTQRLLAEQSAAEAHTARRQAARLADAQQDLVDRAASQRAARAAALRSIEGNVAARAALVDKLTARIQELKAAALSNWLRDATEIPSGPAPAWAGSLPAAGRPLAAAIDAAAANAGIDGRLFAALVWTESSFHPGAVSPHGALGLAQLMPSTASGLGVDPYDPVQNLAGGARYLRQQLDRFGSVELALAAYNAGPGAVEAAGRQIPDKVETQLYVLRILDRWERIG